MDDKSFFERIGYVKAFNPFGANGCEALPNDDDLEIYNVDNGRLLRLLENHFSLEELNTLMFELDIDYEKLPGQDKTSKARELIKYCERHDTLTKLLKNACRRRPSADWLSCVYIWLPDV